MRGQLLTKFCIKKFVVSDLPQGYKGARNTRACKNHRARVSTLLVGGFTRARVNHGLNYSSGK